MTDEKSPGDAPKKDAPAPAPSHTSNYSGATQPARPLSGEQQWHLALAHLAVSDRAANMLRALLFVSALALVAFILSALRPDSKGLPLLAHGLSFLFGAAALGCVVKSFRLQSEQSYERFRLLKDGNLEGLAQHDSVVEQLPARQSSTWARVAIWSLAAALLVEILARLWFTAALVNV